MPFRPCLYVFYTVSSHILFIPTQHFSSNAFRIRQVSLYFYTKQDVHGPCGLPEQQFLAITKLSQNITLPAPQFTEEKKPKLNDNLLKAFCSLF